jgi:hypothetical protein
MSLIWPFEFELAMSWSQTKRAWDPGAEFDLHPSANSVMI